MLVGVLCAWPAQKQRVGGSSALEVDTSDQREQKIVQRARCFAFLPTFSRPHHVYFAAGGAVTLVNFVEI